MSEELIAQRMKRVRPSPTAAISDTVRAMQQQGIDVINLGEGELDFDTPEPIKQAGIDAIRRGETKYTAVSGTVELKQAVIGKFRRENDLDYRPEEVIAGSGAKQLIFNAFLATISPGDEVIIPAPYWVSYPDMAALAEGEARIVPCGEQSGWKLNAADLANAITPRTRWLILNSPNNPTGAVYSRAQLRALAEVLLSAPQVLILADDIYEHIRHDTDDFVTLAQVEPRLRARTLTVNGLSKGYSMTGWRIGYAGGPAWLIAAMQVLQSQSTSNPSAISQAAAVAALSAPATFHAGWLKTLAARRERVMSLIARVPGLSAATPPGAFYVFANCGGLLGKTTPAGNVLASDGDVARYLVEHARVATLQGAAFGASPYLRLAYAIDDQRLAEACERILTACLALR
ncbi:pyridoxal phosphate-dependent aminotransferase [Martelella alba]|uniref:Aminotransferase n=1 Tax=Martelella alba TaxID=2590451 RepID=A0ABY2SQ40_9HYPH|nr:pyridoxal phosphate-dependent aminotransferase [Martelella alba]TKI05959.1 pyridoxal phosphate-dependent aminotransferase [Martelella alba]